MTSRTIWFSTGNNLRIVDDLTRRSLVCHLDSGLEEPERKQFNGDPLASIMRDRGRHVANALIVLRAYLAAGSPARLPRLASYGAWSDLVPSALAYYGYDDPCATMRTARADDPSFEQRNAVFAAWPPDSTDEDGALTSAELVKRAEANVDLKDALVAVAPGGPSGIDPTRLGKWLAANKGRIANGVRLHQAKSRAGRSRWFVQRSQPNR